MVVGFNIFGAMLCVVASLQMVQAAVTSGNCHEIIAYTYPIGNEVAGKQDSVINGVVKYTYKQTDFTVETSLTPNLGKVNGVAIEEATFKSGGNSRYVTVFFYTSPRVTYDMESDSECKMTYANQSVQKIHVIDGDDE